MYAAEHNVPRLAPRGGQLRELQTVAGEVGKADHLVALVMMSEDAQRRAELLLALGDALGQLVARHAVVLQR